MLFFLKIIFLIIIGFSSLQLNAKTISNDTKKIYIDEQIRFSRGLIERQHYQLAIDEYKRLIKRFPNNKFIQNVFLELANAYALSKDYKNAQITFQYFFKKFPNSTLTNNIRLHYALLLNKMGDKKESISLLKSLKNNQKSQKIIQEIAQYYLGEFYLKNNQIEKAKLEWTSLAKQPFLNQNDIYKAKAAINLAKLLPTEKAIIILKPFEITNKLSPKIAQKGLLTLADTFYLAKQYKKAAYTYANFAIIYPNSPQKGVIYYKKLNCLLQQREFSKLIKDSEQILIKKEKLEKSIKNNIYFLRGIALQQLNFNKKAELIFRHIINVSDNPKLKNTALTYLIQVLIANKKITDAHHLLELNIKEKSFKLKTLVNILIILLNAENNNPKYLTNINTLLNQKHKPNANFANNLLLKKALILQKMGKVQEAFSIYDKIMKNASIEFAPLAGLNKAELLKKQGKKKEALNLYKNLLKKYPNTPLYPNIMLESAILLMDDPKSLDTANIYFTKIIEKYPTSIFAKSAAFYKAFILFHKKEFHNANTILSNLAKQKNLNPAILINILIYRSWIALKNGDTKKAISLLNNKYTKICNTANTAYLIELGRNTIKIKPELAIIAYKRLLAIGNKNEKQLAYIGLADTYFKLADTGKSIKFLKIAIKSNNNPKLTCQASTKLGYIFLQRNSDAEAVMCFQKAIDNPNNQKAVESARLGMAKVLSKDKKRLELANRYAMNVFILAKDNQICSEAMILSMQLSLQLKKQKQAISTWNEFAKRFPILAKKTDMIELHNKIIHK